MALSPSSLVGQPSSAAIRRPPGLACALRDRLGAQCSELAASALGGGRARGPRLVLVACRAAQERLGHL